ncbi:hypothetical protein C7H19_19375 [Aphanothece hegewaldii CCALA 016]|uniref:DNA methylase N-4/N-6 domain-containing protein n=1 Tax=Aphanothece hegewaldii CCALA 016 TaxID=2107694 RepID=A0A2T1LTF3_9CHRO|nr:site-specific DNA-methyltransferase [Aphanothece hegewaldii]PSF33886.1 hypothetical protein C7H19_19375 [Aphanothece hegewaldii CCALA 016]
MTSYRRRKDSAKLVWDNKPKRAPNPKDIEFQTAEIVIPNPQEDQGKLPLFAMPQPGVTSLFPGQMGELPLGGFNIDKTKMNRLIWGDNLLAMQALLAQGYAGKIDLIYIDPPFQSSADYSFDLKIEGKTIEKEANIIERLAYIDTWEGGLDSYLDMIYPRLQLMKRLLSSKGSIYIHLDWHIGHYVKIILDEIFGLDSFRNEIIWKRTSARSDSHTYNHIHDVVFLYSRSDEFTYNVQYTDYDQSYIDNFYRSVEEGTGRKYTLDNVASPNPRPNMMYKWRGFDPPDKGWRYEYETMERLYSEGLIVFSNTMRPRRKRYLDEMPGVPLQSIWTDINPLSAQAIENYNYPTQKPETFLERIIKASSNEGDLVADFFCGSGTTMAVAERLNRRWIGCNLDKVGIQVSRNRLVNQQASPFLLENIGNYQRHMIYLSGSRINEMQRIILKLYEAFPRSDRPDLGVRGDELVYVGYPDRPVTAKKAIELAEDAQILDGTGYSTLVILAWDYDYNFTTELESRTKALKGKLKTEIKTLTIPPEIYNYLKKAKNEEDLAGLKDKILFHEKPYFRIGTPKVQDMGDGNVVITIEIARYVLMDFPLSDDKQKAELRKVIKDNFAALIDYWAVDWDYDGKTFKSQWQAIRGNGKRSSTVVTVATSPELPKGNRAHPSGSARQIAVRLVDVFGNDASATVELK